VRSFPMFRRGGFLAAVGLFVLASSCGRSAAPDGPSVGATIEPVTDPVVERPTPDSAHLEDLVVGLNDVGYQVFRAASQDSEDDLVLSPLSIGVAFGMADAGATGATADALAGLFGYPVAGEERWAVFNALEQSVTDDAGPVVVRLANRQFPDAGFETVDGYDERLQRWFGAGIEPLPLRSESEASREHINRWVAERTEDLIPELLPDGFLDEDSVMVLVNALYLEADWARPFGKYPTEDAVFTRLDGSTSTVPLMHELELTGPAVATSEYAATELPYEGGDLSMLVIVPETGHYEDVEARLATDLIDEIDAAATSGAVELYLPRFESSAHLDLRAILEDELGVDDLFGVPGFAGIASYITLEDAVHAADITVDEIGTVAAAATALGFAESGPPQPDVTVRADRPFLYLIRHQPTGAVLFVGRVMDPSA
jgi:serpin B